MPIPTSLVKEHQRLRSILEPATEETGRLGVSARALADILIPHLERGEEFALPPLGLLTVHEIKHGGEVDETMAMTNRLREELVSLLAEQAKLGKAAKAFSEIADAEGRMEHVKFAEDLLDYLRLEEEVLFPTALLIGSYLHLRVSERVSSG